MVTTTTLNFTAAATSKSYAYQIASIVSTNWPKYTHYYFEKKSIDSFSSSSYIIFLNNSYEEERKKYINPCALLSLFFSVSLYRLHIFLLRFISVLTCFFFSCIVIESEDFLRQGNVKNIHQHRVLFSKFVSKIAYSFAYIRVLIYILDFDRFSQ